MSLLLIYLSETEKFNADLVRKFLNTCPGVYNIKERSDERTLMTAEYDFDGDSTMFDLGADFQSGVRSRR
jgi:hypothetical protein